MQELLVNRPYANVYRVHIVSNIIATRKEELHHSFFVLPLSSPPASHSKENKKNPMLVLTAPV
jgi:hypothetical protein